jgi:hypothetical protein
LSAVNTVDLKPKTKMEIQYQTMEKKTSLTDKGEEHHTPSYNIMDNGEGHH